MYDEANPIKISAWQKGRTRPIPVGGQMNAGEKRAIRGEKGPKCPFFGITNPPAIGAYREGAAAAGSTHPEKIRPITV